MMVEVFRHVCVVSLTPTCTDGIVVEIDRQEPLHASLPRLETRTTDIRAQLNNRRRPRETSRLGDDTADPAQAKLKHCSVFAHRRALTLSGIGMLSRSGPRVHASS